MPARRARRRRRAPPPGPGGGRRPQLDARQDVPEDREVAAALDARRRSAPRAAAGRRPRGANRRIATPETAAVRSAVIGPPSRIAVGHAGRRVVRARRGRGSRAGRARGSPGSRRSTSSRRGRRAPSGSAPRRWAGIAWPNEPSGRGWTPIFGGSSASATSATIVRSASAQALVERRHRRLDVAAPRGSAARARSVGPTSAASLAPGTMAAMPPDTAQSLENLSSSATRSSSTTPSPTIEKDPQPGGGVPAGSPPTSGATPTSGPASSRSAAPTCRRRRPGPRLARRGHRPARPPVRDAGRLATSSPRSRATRRTLYESQSSPEVAAIAADEREHAEIWRQLKTGETTLSPTEDIAARERWHRSGRSGTLRAVIFGVSDGLVSNLALVMGVAGRRPATEGRFILLAGIAGLARRRVQHGRRRVHLDAVASASCSSARSPSSAPSSRRCPRRSRPRWPRSTGRRASARTRRRRSPHRLFENPERALDTLVREELGLDPDELGSPSGRRSGSFVAFAFGAAVPVLPYLFASGAGRVRRRRSCSASWRCSRSAPASAC